MVREWLVGSILHSLVHGELIAFHQALGMADYLGGKPFQFGGKEIILGQKTQDQFGQKNDVHFGLTMSWTNGGVRQLMVKDINFP